MHGFGTPMRRWMAAIGLVIGLPALRAETVYLQPVDVGTFNGRTWSGVTLGASTQKEVKKRFKTGRSDFEHALSISQPKGSPLSVHALCAGKEQPVTALVLRYDNGGPDLSSLTANVKSPPRVMYPLTRYEDWRYALWPDRGIVAFVLSAPEGDRVPLIALARPAEVARMAASLTERQTPVSEYVDPHADEPKVMRFGHVHVDYSVRGLRVNESRERLSWEERMRYATAGRTMRYDPGEPGSYTASVSANYDPKKGGSVSVSCRISGEGPYGRVSGNGSASNSLPKAGRERLEDLRDSVQYTRAFLEAMQQAERDFERNMLKSGPPPIESFRLTDWGKAADLLRGMTTPGGETPGVPSPGGATPGVPTPAAERP